MGALVNGVWTDESFPTSKDGRFKRPATAFRDTIAPGGRFAPERNRYHLYVSYACPWAHRTLVFRKLKQLEEVIPVTVVDAFMGDQGWAFGEQADPLYGKKNLHELYTEADRKFTGRVTVPVLWDKKEATIVNNESSEIIRIFNSAFNDLTGNTQDFYPERLREKIDAINSMVYDNVNNGVYKVGFAKTQKVYEEAAFKLFDALEELEKRLSKQRYLVGNTLTEADWRLFTTLVRFDPVYVYHFKCNLRHIRCYENLFGYLCDLYQTGGVADTVRLDHIKTHYYSSHKMINPYGIVPVGPLVDYGQPHSRYQLG